MPWDYQRARDRIDHFLTTVPQIDPDADLQAHLYRLHEARAVAKAQSQWPLGRAVLVDGVHLYGVLWAVQELSLYAPKGQQ